MKNIGLIFGGKSAEHHVSIISARSFLKNYSNPNCKIIPFYIDIFGQWSNTQLGKEKLASNDLRLFLLDPTNENFIENFKYVDVFFPLVHGTNGEDGVLQGFIETIGKPYTSGKVLASSICMDKEFTKKILEFHHLPITPYVTLHFQKWNTGNELYLEAIEHKFPYPVFVKPANSGSSIGISKAHQREELIAAIQLGFEYDEKLLVEPGMIVREIELAVMGNYEIIVSQPGEIIPGAEYYDYKDKYFNNTSKVEIPAIVQKHYSEKIRELARLAYEVLEIKSFARIDFFIEKDTNHIYINEVNTIPGFTPISMFPKLMETAGYSYNQLIDYLLELAMQKYSEKEKRTLNFVKHAIGSEV